MAAEPAARPDHLAEQLLAAFLHAPAGVAVLARDGRFLRANPALARLLGRPVEELLVLRWADVVHRDDACAWPGDRRVRVVRPDGGEVCVRVAVRAVDGSAENPARVVVYCDAVVAAERELERRAARLEESNADLEAFAYVAGHDLQEPLRSIQLIAGTVSEAAATRLDEDERGLLGHIEEAATRMSAQVTSLMRLAQLAVAPPLGAPVPAELAVDDALAALRAAIRDSDAYVEVQRPLRDVAMARSELAVLMQNLIANAIKYRRQDERPHVTISATEADGHVELRVCDNGIGLSEADAAKIFGLFQRARPGPPGVGLGLAICRRVLERRGGSLAAASDGPGRGSQFTLRLPAPPG
jgi:signal transduction histidine kinase